jgi:hypothetical protein
MTLVYSFYKHWLPAIGQARSGPAPLLNRLPLTTVAVFLFGSW